MFSLNTAGRNRLVILTRKHALKLPSLRSWTDFLYGLLNNMNESRLWRTDPVGRCPVLWSAPGGFLVVMPRAVPLTEDTFWGACPKHLGFHVTNVEWKPDSFGWLGSKIVALDYGWPSAMKFSTSGDVVFVDTSTR